jgi:Flp pilus assembly protein TadB
MKVGWLEIVLIILVVIAVTVIARIAGAGRRDRVPDTPRDKRRPGKSLNRTGIFLIIAGIAGLIVAAGCFRLVLQSYLWALIVIAAGTILVFIARRRR